jgi:MoaA/NifB/PqqE/SkfB family radical SAM enzyme
MQALYSDGVRVIFFYGGEPFLWHDGAMSLQDLVKEARKMGFLFVNIVTNGTFSLTLPEADLILVSLDGPQAIHDRIRGDSFDTVLANISKSGSRNICVYMSINQINKNDIESTCEIVAALPTVRAISFNFHTPYAGVEDLQLNRAEKQLCVNRIEDLMDQGYSILNLRSAFPYIVDNSFRTPCNQCVIIENGERWLCGRCVDVPGLCAQCGFFFPAELSLVFDFHIPVMIDMLRTYAKCLWE